MWWEKKDEANDENEPSDQIIFLFELVFCRLLFDQKTIEEMDSDSNKTFFKKKFEKLQNIFSGFQNIFAELKFYSLKELFTICNCVENFSQITDLDAWLMSNLNRSHLCLSQIIGKIKTIHD